MKISEHFRTPEDRLFWLKRLYGRPDRLAEVFPRIIFHTASLGEFTGAVPVIKKLRESGFSGSIVISVDTPAAYRKAKPLESSDPFLSVTPAPLENPASVKIFLETLRPSLFVNFEAEYWPLLFFWLKRNKIPAILVNGRISDRSFRGYKIFATLFRPIFEYFSRLGMVSEEYRERAISLGASPGSTFVTGNSKYDNLIGQRRKERAIKWRNNLAGNGKNPVFVAGNLRGKEYRLVFDAVDRLKKDFPKLLTVLAPRHLHRIGEIVREAKKRNLNPCLLSRIKDGATIKNRSEIIIVDSFGLLFDLYGAADVTFCGGTFEPVGGHNIVEPAVWGKKVLYGPFVQKVKREHSIMEKWGIGASCRNLDEFTYNLRKILTDNEPVPEETITLALRELTGSSSIYASWIIELIKETRV